MGYKIAFASFMVTSSQKTYYECTKNKKQQTKSYHQRKLALLKEDRKESNKEEKTTNYPEKK